MASRFSTEQQDQYRNEARQAGADDAYINDFLSRNPDDYNRLAESYASTNHRPYDSQSTNPQHKAANKSADIAAGSPLQHAWGGNNDQIGGGSGGGNTTAQSWSMPGGGGGMFSQLSAQGGVNKERSNSIFATLMDRINQSKEVSRTDPSVRPQTDAYAAQQEKARRNFVSDTAERMGPDANIQGERRMAAERMGHSVGEVESGLMARELTARREEIAQSLAQAGGMLSEDKKLELQSQIALMDNAIREQQLGVQKYGIDKNAELGHAGLGVTSAGQNLDWQGRLLNNDQFLRQLGLNEWDRTNYWDALRSGQLG